MKSRIFVFVLAIALVLFGMLSLLGCKEGVREGEVRYTDFVNVFIGTGGHGHTFPGATLPHGMVQLSPDTRLLEWDACAGYHYDDEFIHGFSHTHLNGTGRGDYGDILFMPMVGEKPLVSGVDREERGYRSRFSHETEQGRPGYYRVLLEDDQIGVELTTTLRAGMHRYRFESGGDNRLMIDMEPTIHGHPHPITEIEVLNDSTVAGVKYTEGWASRHYVYFYAVFSQPFDYALYADELPLAGEKKVTDESSKAVLKFLPVEGVQEVLVKVGISSVDRLGARRNVEKEIPLWDFDAVACRADSIWNEELRVIDIETEDTTSMTIFYTSLYHTAIQPSLASDVDGRYRTMGHEIKQDTGYTNYTVFSLWDTYRAAHPLYTVIKPELNQAFIRSLLRKYDEMGLLPKWELASNETGTMIGYHAVSVIVDALMKGQRDFDVQKAFEACVRSSVYDTTGVHAAMERWILHEKVMPISIEYKNELGWVPSDKVSNAAVSQGLEYAYNDWLIAVFAEFLGEKAVQELYDKRSNAFRNYFDASTNMMRGRNLDGSWVEPFNPLLVERPSNYIEGNAWQWAWFVPHDVDALMELWGGKDAFSKGLDSLFQMSSTVMGDPHVILDVTGMIGQYAHGNEPGHHIPYMYNFTGAYEKTQVLVDSILRHLYWNDPNGLCGNEDVGQMSAWYVFGSMGFYPFCPGDPAYSIGKPLFDRVTIRLAEGKSFVIEAMDAPSTVEFFDRVELNGRCLSDRRLLHSDVMEGGRLRFF